jgi:hypothetical protein
VEVLQALTKAKWDGAIVAEINTRKAKTEAERLVLLAETLAFARLHTREPRRRMPRTRKMIDALRSGSAD